MNEKFTGEFDVENEIADAETNTFTVQMRVEQHLFRGINDIFSKTKKDKQFYNDCHIEI